MNPISLFNTQGRSLNMLNKPAGSEVTIYCCGPTVYNYQHIGNLRTYVFEDLLTRTLRSAGYLVKHVMNITDVGHLVSDADDGEDKMLLASKKEGKKSEEIASYYTQIFFDDCKELNIIRPNIVCKATEHISQMISLIEKLVNNGSAYLSGGNVYFDVTTCKDYGKLAGLNLESLQAGARIEVDSQKRNPQDFALWFTKSKFENQELTWDSPWGTGYPGWHIECSAMAMEYLGESFDIHCGGIDHIPVHHTNEIAQSECATGKTFANIWMHGGFLVESTGKMSKSKGDFLTLSTLKEKGFDPLAYRYMCLQSHYRTELSWSWDSLQGAENAYKKLKQKAQTLDSKLEKDEEKLLNLSTPFLNALYNDLNAPQALARLYELLNDKSISDSDKRNCIERFDTILGLNLLEQIENEIPESVLSLAKERDVARKAKDFKRSDEIRDKIASLGYNIQDSPEGTKVTLK